MRCIANGTEGGTITIELGEDVAINIIVLSDYGQSLGDGTVTAKFYATNDRSVSPVKSFTVTNQKLVIGNTEATLANNTTYYVYVEHETSGGTIRVSDTPFAVEVN